MDIVCFLDYLTINVSTAKAIHTDNNMGTGTLVNKIFTQQLQNYSLLMMRMYSFPQ
jgi:hypothetical protein